MKDYFYAAVLILLGISIFAGYSAIVKNTPPGTKGVFTGNDLSPALKSFVIILSGTLVATGIGLAILKAFKKI